MSKTSDKNSAPAETDEEIRANFCCKLKSVYNVCWCFEMTYKGSMNLLGHIFWNKAWEKGIVIFFPNLVKLCFPTQLQ